MILLNDGKLNLFDIKIINRRYELNLFLTSDCSNKLREYALFEFKIWRYFKKPFFTFKLKKVYKHEKIRLICKP